MTNLTPFVKLLILEDMQFTKRGFTLIELLIVMAILGVLATTGFANFVSSRLKAKDISRKSDLQMVAKSLEAYVNDYRGYPDSSAAGEIMVAGVAIPWGSPFADANTTYATVLPVDPSGYKYFYVKSGSGYYLYGHLENAQDSKIYAPATPGCGGTEPSCNYKISSSNL
ncbi:MAG: type II secretion system protein [Microgenomates group bacterium]